MPNYRTITTLGRVSMAKNFLGNDIWICIGRTTPWNDEDSPPEASVDTTSIDEPIIYKKINQKYHVRPVTSDGDFYIDGQWYRIISESEARSTKSAYTIVVATIAYNDIGDDSVTYRQAGLYCYLVPREGYENYTLLTPDQVADAGWMVWYANFEPIYVQQNHEQTFRIVFAF